MDTFLKNIVKITTALYGTDAELTEAQHANVTQALQAYYLQRIMYTLDDIASNIQNRSN